MHPMHVYAPNGVLLSAINIGIFYLPAREPLPQTLINFDILSNNV